MTKQERKYLRAIYHHYDNLKIRHTNTPDTRELAAEWRNHNTMMYLVYLVLTLKTDFAGQSIDDLNDLFDQHKIKFLDD